MMTQKDFNLVAHVLNVTMAATCDDCTRNGVRLAAQALANNLRESNPRFSPERFMAAVTK